MPAATLAVGEQSSAPFVVSPWGKYAAVAAYTGFSIAHLEKAAYSGALNSHGTGKARRFNRADVDEWMRHGAKAVSR